MIIVINPKEELKTWFQNVHFKFVQFELKHYTDMTVLDDQGTFCCVVSAPHFPEITCHQKVCDERNFLCKLSLFISTIQLFLCSSFAAAVDEKRISPCAADDFPCQRAIRHWAFRGADVKAFMDWKLSLREFAQLWALLREIILWLQIFNFLRVVPRSWLGIHRCKVTEPVIHLVMAVYVVCWQTPLKFSLFCAEYLCRYWFYLIGGSWLSLFMWR